MPHKPPVTRRSLKLLQVNISSFLLSKALPSAGLSYRQLYIFLWASFHPSVGIQDQPDRLMSGNNSTGRSEYYSVPARFTAELMADLSEFKQTSFCLSNPAIPLCCLHSSSSKKSPSFEGERANSAQGAKSNSPRQKIPRSNLTRGRIFMQISYCLTPTVCNMGIILTQHTGLLSASQGEVAVLNTLS